MKLTTLCLVALVATALAACGGGESVPVSLTDRLGTAQRSLADPSLCAADNPGYAVVEGECQKLFTDVVAAPAKQAETGSAEPTGGPLRAASVSPSAFFNWAQIYYPTLFPGTYWENSEYVPGYGVFLYRYYYASANYLAILNGYVYVLGPVTGWSIMPIAPLDGYYCSIYVCAPSRTFINWTNSANGVVVKDSTNESFAFFSDSRCLYSYNRDQETTNFCLYAGSSNGSFAGTYVQVMLATSTTGGCIAVLADWYGRQVDIYTNAAGIQIVSPQSSYWETRGCR